MFTCKLTITKNNLKVFFYQVVVYFFNNFKGVIELTAVGPNKVIMKGSKSKRYLCLDRKNNWITQVTFIVLLKLSTEN